MATNLTEYLAERRCAGFNPVPHYFASGDYLTFFFRDDRAIAEPVDDLLTVFRSMADGALVGCKFTGVKRILESADSFGVRLDEGGIFKLGILFFVGASMARDEIQRRRYAELREVVKGQHFAIAG